MTLQEQLPLWNYASIRVLDVRQSTLLPGESVHEFRLPASAFLFAAAGCAAVKIDGTEHIVDRYFVCHAGKGAAVDIEQVSKEFQYYFIFYKAAVALPCRQELLDIYRDHNPFQMQYGFAPSHPLGLHVRLEQMYAQWRLGLQLERFHVRALFHQLVYELLQQLHESGNTAIIQPDMASQAVRFIDERYADAFSLHDLAEALHCSPRQLQRLFKAKLGSGPMEYLTSVRMEHAKRMLVSTDVPLKEIAEAVGYGDSYYFSRAFKKHAGDAPLHYRNKRRISASILSRNVIGLGSNVPYSDVCDNDYHKHHRDRGVIRMNRSNKPMLAVSLMLSFILLLGACSAGAGTSHNSGGASPTASSSAISSPVASAVPTAEQAYPVVIKHMKGEYTLEQRPEKIAVLDTKFADQLVTLGEQPAGSVKAAADTTDFPAYLMDKMSETKLLGTRDEPNMEAILEMDPDLIICTEFQEEVYEQLSMIAPTIMLEFDEDWRDTLSTFGKMVGKQEEAGNVLKAYEEKTAKLKEELKAKLGEETVALIRPRDDGIRVHTPGHRTAAILYNDLGLLAPEQVTAEKDTAYHIALEAFPAVGADHYFLVNDAMFKSVVEEFQATETWKSVEAVKQNRVYAVESATWIAYYGPIAINMVVDEVADIFLGQS
ncbi:helix-turn-helix domain-containing protein [Paenibacillus sp. GCM10027627]|uniref:helix-turn-helix domain-containing protein n=1 Tax=unclassified Paenibacillus TaxID=185978 RepID=UPI00363DF6C1